MKERIAIKSMSTISALGSDEAEIWNNYLRGESRIQLYEIGGIKSLVSCISDKNKEQLSLFKEDKHYADLDPSVWMALFCARRAYMSSGWENTPVGINIGSSRGATNLLEKYHEEFIQSGKKSVSTLSSPTTTLGNISSWVGHDLQLTGPTISHSIACSTALHGVLNGVAWLKSRLSDAFMAGGTEASNTPFSIAQMKALKIYSNRSDDFPCRSLDPTKRRNSMVLGEAAGVFCLERSSSEDALAYIDGLGYATEPLDHNISISTDAECFQTSMKMALQGVDRNEVDVIVAHAPGTIKGDSSEMNAIRKVFGEEVPAVTSNKWLIGHSLGASGAMSLEMALLMMKHQHFIGIPYLKDQERPNKIRKALINAVGFGGNAVSILVSLD